MLEGFLQNLADNLIALSLGEASDCGFLADQCQFASVRPKPLPAVSHIRGDA